MHDHRREGVGDRGGKHDQIYVLSVILNDVINKKFYNTHTHTHTSAIIVN